MRQAKKEGLIESEYFGHQIDDAEKGDIINQKEADSLREFHQKVLDLMSVDDFAPGDIGRTSTAVPTAPAKSSAKPSTKKATTTRKATSTKKPTRKKAKSSNKKKAS